MWEEYEILKLESYQGLDDTTQFQSTPGLCTFTRSLACTRFQLIPYTSVKLLSAYFISLQFCKVCATFFSIKFITSERVLQSLDHVTILRLTKITRTRDMKLLHFVNVTTLNIFIAPYSDRGSAIQDAKWWHSLEIPRVSKVISLCRALDTINVPPIYQTHALSRVIIVWVFQSSLLLKSYIQCILECLSQLVIKPTQLTLYMEYLHVSLLLWGTLFS